MCFCFTIFSSSVGKKIIMGLTGLFLCTFLVIHLIGNFQLLKDDNGIAFNQYSQFMSTNKLIKVMEIVMVLGFLFHIISAILLTRQNNLARPVDYFMNKTAGKSTIASRNMGLTGTVIFFFLVVHLKDYWYTYHFHEDANMYQIVVESFKQFWYVILYLITLILLGVHLSHGFQSAFQTLGINHAKYTPTIILAGKVFSLLIVIGFAIFPLYFYFKQ